MMERSFKSEEVMGQGGGGGLWQNMLEGNRSLSAVEKGLRIIGGEGKEV